jgi:hypothetical protein
VSFASTALATTFVSPSRLTASGTATIAQPSVPVVATMADGTTSNTAFVTVTAPAPVAITISPSSATVRLKQSRQFAASVTGTSNTAVVWKVNGNAGGNGTVGTVSATGLYRAPKRLPSPATVAVSATSVADPLKSATAQVTVTR